MGHGEIRKAMRELEDQQREDYKRYLGQTALTNTAIELHRRARQKEISSLCDLVHGLEYKQKSFVAELKAAYSNRHGAEAALRERIVKLESENAEIRKGQVANRDAIADIRFQFDAVKRPLEHRVGLQDQVDLLQKSIGDLAEQVVRLEQEGDDEFWKSAWVPHGPKQRKQRWQQKCRQALVDYIGNEIPNEKCPTEVEDVAETAIRLLKMYRAALKEIEDGLGAASEDRMRRPLTQAYVIARDTLRGKTQ